MGKYIFNRKEKYHKSSYRPAGWSTLVGALIALLLSAAILYGGARHVARHSHYHEPHVQYEVYKYEDGLQGWMPLEGW